MTKNQIFVSSPVIFIWLQHPCLLQQQRSFQEQKYSELAHLRTKNIHPISHEYTVYICNLLSVMFSVGKKKNMPKTLLRCPHDTAHSLIMNYQ